MIKAGPYRYSRNPIYLSFLVFQFGYGFVELQAWILMTLPLSYLVLRYHVISSEEDYLTREFGEQYRQFCDEVRRWL
jgi:protein-S-isoprenylcysteine O-methyltransferase Ste14